ncbi:unnamed protein product [Caenorhabditis auriculariae]|uniref:Uncharacterized protein n=1 Tax=Caenorhabditis auriculariae TaxID=2777116 RepID=A0A8S1GY64_9PELO|nr:unnamed protein product [Caenorhabditis auriculariae]
MAEYEKLGDINAPKPPPPRFYQSQTPPPPPPPPLSKTPFSRTPVAKTPILRTLTPSRTPTRTPTKTPTKTPPAGKRPREKIENEEESRVKSVQAKFVTKKRKSRDRERGKVPSKELVKLEKSMFCYKFLYYFCTLAWFFFFFGFAYSYLCRLGYLDSRPFSDFLRYKKSHKS